MMPLPRVFRYLLLLVSCLAIAPLHAQTTSPIATTTTLAVGPSASVASGTLVTLTASVADTNGPVVHGSVSFYDGTSLITTLQLVSNSSAGYTPGTANLKTLALTVGMHSVTATFHTTNTDATSTSSTQTVTITGPARSVSSLTWSGPRSSGNSLTISVSGAENTTPTGNATFTEVTSGSPLGNSNLTAASASGFVIGPTMSLPSLLPQAEATPAIRDVNHDGIDDLVEIGPGSSTNGTDVIYTLLGNGDGTFEAPITTTIPYQVGGPIFLLDVNGDGNEDLITPSLVFPGNGDGTFRTSAITSSLSDAGTAISMADFNGDGIPDILSQQISINFEIPDDYSDTLSIAIGNGDGTFNSGPVISFDSPSAYPSDVIGQGFLVHSGGSGTEVISAAQLANGTFTSLTSLPMNNIAIGDLNGDGFPDIVAGTNDDVSTWINNKSGGFTALPSFGIQIPFAGGSTAFNLTDFNRDGKLDAVYYDGVNLYVLLGNGDGTFSPTPLETSPVDPTVNTTIPDESVNQILYTGNFRGFGRNDLLLPNMGGGLNLVTSSNFSASATLQNLDLPATGVQQIVSEYSGDSTFSGSTSNTLSLAAPLTPVVLFEGANPQSFNVNSTYPLEVSVANAASSTEGKIGPIPTGTVQLLDSGVAVGTAVAVTNGVVDLSVASLAVGTHQLTATYSGDTNYASVTTAPLTVYITEPITLTSSYSGPASVVSGSPVTIPFQLTTSVSGVPNPTGTISLLGNNNATLASASISGNPPYNVSFQVNTSAQPLTIGKYSFYGSYSGDHNWTAATTSSINLQVLGQVSLSLTSGTSSPVASGTPITLSGKIAEVTAFSAAPTQTVTLLDNGKAISSVQLNMTGLTFSFQVNTASAPLTAGQHSFTLSYSGDPNWAAATSNALSITIDAAPTIAISSSLTAGASLYNGATATFTATVADLGNGPAPTGTVQFHDGITAIGAPVSILQGVATYSSSQFAVGSHSITATYSGDTNYPSATSSAFAFQVVSTTTDTLAVVPSATSSISGSVLTVQVVVTSPAVVSAPAPTGTATLNIDGAVFASSSVAGARTSFSINTATAPLSQGTHALTASYTGNSFYPASTAPAANITITGNVPRFTLTSNAGSYTSIVQGTALTFTATVGATNGLPTPTGSVQFYVDGAVAGSPVPLASGVATYTTSSLAVGMHTITAAYGGNGIYNSTSTNGTAAIVTQGTDAIALSTTGASSVTAGTPLAINGTLSVSSLGPAPTGTVALLDGSTTIATTSLSGNAPFALSFTVNTAAQPLAAGTHSFSLQYAGTAQWAASTSAAVTEEIGGVMPSISSPTVSVTPGGTATETITVAALGGLNDTTTFACSSGLPQGATCSFSPTSITGSGTTTLTLTTTGSTSAVAYPNRLLTATGSAALACLAFFLVPRRKRNWAQMLGIFFLIAVLTTGCGGGGGSSSGSGSGNSTPAGSYTITVTSTSGSGATAITNKIQFQLTVT